MRKPDFFIVGAPKCGTTAMHQYLSGHPDICMPYAKEIHFFGTDLRPPHVRKDVDEYLAIFSSCKGERRAGEASVWYLSSKTAAHEIKAFSPSADILIMLRNPVDMLYAQYYQFLYKGADLPPLEEALRNEEQRKRQYEEALAEGKWSGRLFHTQNALFTEQVQRYLDAFGRQHVHVIVYDDLKEDTAKVYGETLEFLGLDPDTRMRFEVVNPSKRLRSGGLQKLYTAAWLQAAGKRLIPRPYGHILLKGFKRLNTRYVPRPPMDPGLRKHLQRMFEPEVERLGALLGRDLTHWSED